MKDNDNKKELYNLSNQMVEIFISNIFSKNNIDLEEAKSNITDEQRESLKQSVAKLKEQVEEFLYEKNATKTVTEDEVKKKVESPLRELFLNRNKQAEE